MHERTDQPDEVAAPPVTDTIANTSISTNTSISSHTDTATPSIRTIPRRKPPAVSVPLPSTALQSTDALEKIMGAPLNAEAVAALIAENASMLDLSPEGLMPGLARNLVVMQALSTKLIAQAMETRNAGAQAALIRTALGASREAREIILLMRDLKAESRSEADRTVGVGG